MGKILNIIMATVILTLSFIATGCSGNNKMVQEAVAATVQENSTAAVQEDSTAAVQEDSTAAVQENSTAAVQENSTAAVQENSAAAVQEDSTATVQEDSTEMIDEEMYADGEYEGKSALTSEGYYGKAKVKIRNFKIQDIYFEIFDTAIFKERAISKYKNLKELLLDESYKEEVYKDMPYYREQTSNELAGMKKYKSELLQKQDIDKVDAISGATWSYQIFTETMKNTLEKADRVVPEEKNKASIKIGSLEEKKLKSEEEIRTYYEYIPTSYKTQKSLPLLIMLHGANGNPVQINEMTNWSSVAEKDNFIVAFPYKQGWWDAYKWDKNADDSFLSNLIEKLKTDYRINDKKVFLCGYSIGASMAITYTFKHTKNLAAVALVSPAWMNSDPMFDIDPYKIPQPQKPIPVYIWRGENEDWPSLDENQSMVEYWSFFNHTSDKPSINKQTKYSTYTYAGSKADVIYTEVSQGTHLSYTPDEFEKIWNDFFSHY